MNRSEWQQQLQAEGAQICEGDSNFINAFEHSAPTTDSFITPLLYQSVLSISGADSNKFLQGQLTCDVNSCTSEHSILGAACSPQGRIYSSFRLINNDLTSEPCYLLRMRSNLVKLSHETLHKYSVFFKTQLQDASDEWFGIGIWGKQATQLVKDTFKLTTPPQQAGDASHSESAIIIRLPGDNSRFECWVKAAVIAEVWQALTAHATPAANHEWLLEDIRQGIAEISLPVESAFNPHMVNFQAVEAISFKKGCYTGQEIVARTHYKGKSKRHMQHFCLTGAPLLAAGDELQAVDSDKTIATVISAALSTLEAADVQEALLVINADLDNGEPLHLQHNGHQIEAIPSTLPYSLDSQDQP